MSLSYSQQSFQMDIKNNYHKLTEFMRNTDNESLVDKKRTARSQKARSKLSSLSTRQFHELNMDVNNELSRRINESFDLTGSHLNWESGVDEDIQKRRNDAKRKLASLSESRFNDLISDLISEIERRGFVKPEEVNETINIFREDAETTLSSKHSSGRVSMPQGDDTQDTTTEDQIDKPNLLKSSTVVPLRTSAEWSSDEDNEDAERALELELQQSLLEKEAERVPVALDNEEPIKLDVEDLLAHGFKETLKYETRKDIIVDEPRDIVPVHAEPEKVEPLHIQPARLEKRPVESILEPLNVVPVLDNDKLDKLEKENEQLKIELQNLRKHQQASLPVSNIKTPHANINLNQIQEFITEDGYVPLNLIERYQNTLNFFYQIISKTNNSLDTELFKVILQTSKIISEILLLVDLPNFKEEVVLLKASLSQAITTVRYYSIYNDMLPRLTIHAALADISFAVCNLVKVTKIRTTGIAYKELRSATNISSLMDKFTKVKLGRQQSQGVEDPEYHTPVKAFRLPRKLNIKNGNESIDESLSKNQQTNNNGSNNLQFHDESRPHTPPRSSSRRNSKQVGHATNGTDDKHLSSSNSKSIKASTIPSSGFDDNGSNSNKNKDSQPNSRKSSIKINDLKKNGNTKMSSSNPGSATRSASSSSLHKDVAKRFTEKIKHFGNNNGMGFRVMSSSKAKVK